MMGFVSTNGSFRNSLRYCLEDKQQQQHSQEVPFKDRAEIIYYHQCYGSAETMARQFREVAQLRQDVSKPVMHISLSLPPNEPVPKSMLVELAKGCANDMNFGQHQYVAILHKDTSHQHIHLVANRIGYDGGLTSDSFSYRRLNEHCRAAELRHGLTPTLNPLRYRSAEERLLPRHDIKLDQLKENISQSLLQSRDVDEFKHRMKERNYTVYHSSRGMAFMDKGLVIFKGSEAGYPYKKIQSILSQDLTVRKEAERLRLEKELRQKQELTQQQSQRQRNTYSQELSL